jgi:hypothetical protein
MADEVFLEIVVDVAEVAAAQAPSRRITLVGRQSAELDEPAVPNHEHGLAGLLPAVAHALVADEQVVLLPPRRPSQVSDSLGEALGHDFGGQREPPVAARHEHVEVPVPRY